MKTGLYFGSFNPVHIGHMAIANYIIEYSMLNQIWFIVSPHNPLKRKESLLNDYDRLKMVEIALEKDNYRFAASDIEFRMARPAYTIDTLTWLKEAYPGNDFSLIMGEDNLYTLHKWKNAGLLVSDHDIFVYPRPGVSMPDNNELKQLLGIARLFHMKAPVIDISGTFIRKAISEGRNIRHFLPPGVWEYIDKMGFYR